MKFFTNSIKTGNGPSFADYVSKRYGKKEEVVKTASVATEEIKEAVATETKEANMDNFGDKKAPPFGKKKKEEDKETKAKAKVKEESKEAEAETKTVEAKKADAGGEGGASSKEKDEADSSGQLDVEPLHQKGESTPSPHKKKESEGDEGIDEGIKEAKGKEPDEADSSGQPEWEGKKEHNNDPEAGKHREGDGDQKECATEAEVKEAAVDCTCCDDKCKKCKACKGCKSCMSADAKEEIKVARYQKIANLDGKSKAWLINYWKNLYPPEYADAMTADK